MFMCFDMGKRLTHIRHQECENVDYNSIVFEQRTYVHYVRLMSELKSKCNAKGGVVFSWGA